MDSKRVNAIITEAINKVINEDFMGEFADNHKHPDHDAVKDNVQSLRKSYVEKLAVVRNTIIMMIMRKRIEKSQRETQTLFAQLLTLKRQT